MKPTLTDDVGFDAQSMMRRANLRRALQLVFLDPGVQTRAGIARATGLTAATASSLVAELIESRYVIEGEQAASTGGKRATTLSVDDHLVVLTMVVHQTEVIATLVGLDGRVIEQSRTEYVPEQTVGVLASIATRWAASHGDRLLVASVQLPGATDGRVVLESVQLGWRDLPLAAQLESILDVPVLLINDVDAEAIAEATISPDQFGYRIFIHLGVGIGATTMLDGVIAPGPRSRAGEIGHVQVVFGDAAVECGCGLTGCLESASSMVAMLGEGFSEGMPEADARALAAAAAPERLAAGVVALARATKLISAMLDPAEVILGGSAAALGEPFLELLRRETAYAASGTSDMRVRFAHPQSEAHLGAAQYALTTVLGVRWNHPV
ncbi:ROK family protein [Microbacterium sp. A84]|uniref:ROK family protein n=1 Tax=Microbacterium sp. A84 TaxID=3450715 RepID=UPI003F444B2C